MNYLFILIACLLVACNTGTADKKQDTGSTPPEEDTLNQPGRDSVAAKQKRSTTPTVFFNQRFRDVELTKLATGKYHISGQAQVFEADFEWLVKTNEIEIMSGFGKTNAGAPGWGDFDFDLQIEQRYANASPTLILYESSAKDGSMQHQLEIPLN